MAAVSQLKSAITVETLSGAPALTFHHHCGITLSYDSVIPYRSHHLVLFAGVV